MSAYSLRSFIEQVMGGTAHNTGCTIIAYHKLEGKTTPEKFISECEEHYDRVFANVQLMPGVEKLL